jgi:Ca2+/Na+ antiporter
MLGLSLLLLPLMLTGRRITRREGVVLLLVYAAYLASLGTVFT